MEHSLFRMRSRGIETLRSRIPLVQKLTWKIRFPRWVWLLTAALILSVWAHRGSQEEGRMEWLSTHAPSPETWKDLLTRRGFYPVEDPVWREKAYAEMPESSRLRASALISEDRHTVALRIAGDWIYYELKGFAGKPVPGQIVNRELWEKLGLGWEAVAAFESIELPLVRIPEGPKAAPQKWKDPRELAY